MSEFREETEFNAALREVLKSHGLKAVHIRETDTPGVVDLLVWDKSWIIAWMELKMGSETLRPSQVEFLREVENGLVVRYVREGGAIVVARIDGRIMAYIDDFRKFDWKNRLKDWAR